jgi:hypothetical protein
MGVCFDRSKLGPGEHLVSSNQPFTHCSGLLGNHLDPLHQDRGIGEKKIQIEAAGRIQDGYGLFEVAAFGSISSS